MLKFTRSTFRALSAVSVAIGQVFFGTFVAGIFLPPFDIGKIIVLVLELILSLTAWILALLFAERGEL